MLPRWRDGDKKSHSQDTKLSLTVCLFRSKTNDCVLIQKLDNWRVYIGLPVPAENVLMLHYTVQEAQLSPRDRVHCTGS